MNTMRPRSKTSDRHRSLRIPAAIPRYASVCLLSAMTVLVCGDALSAQDRPARLFADLPTLSFYTPADAGVFLEIDRLPQIAGEISGQTSARTVRRILGMSGESGWQEAMAKSLGVESSEAIGELFGERLAIAAPAWHRLSEGVILFTQSNPRTLQLIMGQGQVADLRDVGNVTLAKLRTGLWAAIRGQTVILAQDESSRFFKQSIKLLNDQSSAALSAVPAFRQLVAALPTPRDGCLYWSSPREPSDSGAPPIMTDLWPQMPQGAVSMHVRRKRLELYMRGIKRSGGDAPYQPPVVVDRLVTLPQTTLAAWSTSVDVRGLYETLKGGAPMPQLEPLWSALSAVPDAERFESEVVANLGPRCVFVLGCNFANRRASPQFAVLVEADNAEGVVGVLKEYAEQLVEKLTQAGEDQSTIKLVTSEHLGAQIVELHLGAARVEVDGNPIASLLANGMTPCAAALDGWVVLSTSPSQIRDMIEARRRLTPRLADLPSVAEAGTHIRRAVGAGVVQPAFLCSMIDNWKSIAAAGNGTGQARLGIRVRATQTPGEVIVADVDSNGPANGILQPEDAIIACNGSLLSMSDANHHLRQLVNSTGEGRPFVLRALRGSEMIEVSVRPAPATQPPATSQPTGPWSRYGALADVARELAAAVYSVARSSDETYKAHIVLEFAPPPEEVPPE